MSEQVTNFTNAKYLYVNLKPKQTQIINYGLQRKH